jgi:hypothetical protein
LQVLACVILTASILRAIPSTLPIFAQIPRSMCLVKSPLSTMSELEIRANIVLVLTLGHVGCMDNANVASR